MILFISTMAFANPLSLGMQAPLAAKANKKKNKTSAYYAGFGGVAIGYQQYKNFANQQESVGLLDGREGLDDDLIGGTTVTSFYYSRIAKSKFYIGYSISAMFSNRLVTSSDTSSLMMPEWCPSYSTGVDSVNGNAAGGDLDMFQDTEGTYEYGGESYEFSCHNHSGVRSNQESLVHVPIEINLAYVFRPAQKIQVWVAGGISISWYDYQYTFSQNGFSTIYDSYYANREGSDSYEYYYDEASGDVIDYSTIDYTWNYDYRERFGASSAVNEGGWSKLSRSYLPGVQASVGAEYIFGELPRIGGDWGLGLLAKYSYIRGPQLEYKPQSNFNYDMTVGNTELENAKGSSKAKGNEKATPNLSNWNLSASMTWHY